MVRSSDPRPCIRTSPTQRANVMGTRAREPCPTRRYDSNFGSLLGLSQTHFTGAFSSPSELVNGETHSIDCLTGLPSSFQKFIDQHRLVQLLRDRCPADHRQGETAAAIHLRREIEPAAAIAREKGRSARVAGRFQAGQEPLTNPATGRSRSWRRPHSTASIRPRRAKKSITKDLFLTPVFVLIVAKGIHAGTAFAEADGVDPIRILQSCSQPTQAASFMYVRTYS